MSDMDDTSERPASISMADGLVAAFDAFETIRLVARACEDWAPPLFAAFMMAAGAAVEGRNALAGAPSFPPGRGHVIGSAPPPGLDVERVAGDLAAAADELARRLSDVASMAAEEADRTACENAAQAAGEIHLLLVRTGDETVFGEFLASASAHIEALTDSPGPLPDHAVPAAIRYLHRLAASMARLAEGFRQPESDSPAQRRSRQARAEVYARFALGQAAMSMRQAASAVAHHGIDRAHPAVRHVQAAADCLSPDMTCCKPLRPRIARVADRELTLGPSDRVRRD